ncbi:hypothetical protein D5086_007666 [Populus alba]|uniref:Uncharacterized protein n=2 Tax=Populus alba TaxID=43335 RepID=A0ACC4CR97_POPAL|nr:uncharacterized protein D5086_0000271820 [Populus alba]
MGRGRGKGKKLTVSNHDDTGSGEEEKIPAQKRRGRPQKPLKDDIDEEEVEKIEDEDVEKGKTDITSKDSKSPTAAENGKKRKRYSQAKEKPDSVKEENGVGTRSSTDDSTKSNGFRHNGSRRKSKPRRAAEAGVELNSGLLWHNALNDVGLLRKFSSDVQKMKPEKNIEERSSLRISLIRCPSP